MFYMFVIYPYEYVKFHSDFVAWACSTCILHVNVFAAWTKWIHVFHQCQWIRHIPSQAGYEGMSKRFSFCLIIKLFLIFDQMFI